MKIKDLGIVVIGRNEGDRLRICLESVAGLAEAVVYVDSGSTDGSVELAQSLGVEVVGLDLSTPFTAARARNAGLRKLGKLVPGLRYVQFVDGDCEVQGGWLETGRAALEADPELAVVCGRCRERHPERSIYNRLADLEWNTPVGPAESCGGNALYRVGPLREVGGFAPDLIAGEEPELCFRLRRAGWSVQRLDAEMVLHDMAMTRFSQWWRRAIRGGFAAAEAMARHGRSPERFGVRASWSLWFWGLAVPLVALGLAWPTGGLSLFLLGGYLVSAARAARTVRARGASMAQSALYGTFCMLSKFPGLIGQGQYWLGRFRRRPARLIEYKRPRIGAGHSS